MPGMPVPEALCRPVDRTLPGLRFRLNVTMGLDRLV